MPDMLRRLLTGTASQAVAWGVALSYLAVFQIAIGDLTIDGAVRPASMLLAANWEALLLRVRAPFQFEAVAILRLLFTVWLISPMNLAIGLTLGLLIGFQVALARLARRCATACGSGPGIGLLAGVPGLLAGHVCCAPVLLILLGVQMTASLIALMGLLIPAAFVLLLIGLILTLRTATRRCVEAHA